MVDFEPVSVHTDEVLPLDWDTSHADDMILARQIRHAYDSRDIPDVDERITPSLANSLDLAKFPDFDGRNPVRPDSERPRNWASDAYGTVAGFMDIPDNMAHTIYVTGPGIIASGHGYLRGSRLYFNGYIPADITFAFIGKNHKVVAFAEPNLYPFILAYDDLSLAAIHIGVGMVAPWPSDVSVAGVVMITPMEGRQ